MTAASAFGALFLLAIGGGVLAVAYSGFRNGELPAGAGERAHIARAAPTVRWHFIFSSPCISAVAWHWQCGACSSWQAWHHR
jgi:hypothetical protein